MDQLGGRGRHPARPLKIFAWAADTSACAYYRLHLPLDALRERGHTTHASTRMTPEWADADVVVGQRVFMPGPSQTWQHLAAEGCALVYEIDDDLFAVDPSSPAYRVFSDPEAQARIRANATAATLVTVTTEALAEVMRQYNPRVAVLPNRVPSWLLSHRRPRRDRLTVGWAGSATHEIDLAEVSGLLRRHLDRNPHVALHTMGADYREWMRLPGGQSRHTPWLGSVEEFLRRVDFDVELAPLRPHVFNASKSALRPLTAAALGIPVIASDYGEYARFVRDGETGFLVRRDHEWGQYLRLLDRDDAAREEMGVKARALAAAHTIEANAHLWEEVYLRAAELVPSGA